MTALRALGEGSPRPSAGVPRCPRSSLRLVLLRESHGTSGRPCRRRWRGPGDRLDDLLQHLCEGFGDTSHGHSVRLIATLSGGPSGRPRSNLSTSSADGRNKRLQPPSSRPQMGLGTSRRTCLATPPREVVESPGERRRGRPFSESARVAARPFEVLGGRRRLVVGGAIGGFLEAP